LKPVALAAKSRRNPPRPSLLLTRTAIATAAAFRTTNSMELSVIAITQLRPQGLAANDTCLRERSNFHMQSTACRSNATQYDGAIFDRYRDMFVVEIRV
jgi:hypothetical protein